MSQELDKKKIQEIRRLIPQLVQEGLISRKEENKRLVEFYLTLSEEALNSSRVVYKVSTDEEMAKLVGVSDFNGFVWVINPAYYSMFYAANALLSSSGIKICSEIGIHKLTFQAFVYYFYLTGKISAKYVQEFLEEQESAEEILGKERAIKEAEQKAKELVLHLELEREKRTFFTYGLEKFRIENKAKTSLERASNFYKEIKKLLM
ncbi:hypothetical protein J4434_03110 [Candidatus Woesearchaeota archaeon]|nr:hypothetical protein [Candidatus Woesearchaeota archaeon]